MLGLSYPEPADASPHARRALFSPSKPMPPTQWQHGAKSKALRPLHSPVVQRLASKSAPSLALRHGPSTSRSSYRGASQLLEDVPHTHWDRSFTSDLRTSLRGRLEAGGGLLVLLRDRDRGRVQEVKDAARQEERKAHAVRMRSGVGTSDLTVDEIEALQSIFMHCDKVYDTADGLERVDIRGLRVALRTLGYNREEEQVISNAADATGGGGFAASLDGDARLNKAEFVNVFRVAPKPPAVRSRLSSLGRALRAARQEEAEMDFNQRHGLQTPSPYQARQQAGRRPVQELAVEAFPYAVAADAQKVRALVAQFEPPAMKKRQSVGFSTEAGS